MSRLDRTAQSTRFPRNYRGWVWLKPRWEAVAVVMVAATLVKAMLGYAVILAFVREFRYDRRLRATDRRLTPSGSGRRGRSGDDPHRPDERGGRQFRR